MYAIPGLIALLTFIYLRPQEIAPALQSVPFLYLFVLLTALGWVLDLRLGFSRLRSNAMLGWGLGYFAWSALTFAIAKAQGGPTIARELVMIVVSCFLFLVLSQAIQTVSGLRLVAVTLLGLSLGLAAVGVHQAYAPMGCVKQDDLQPEIWRADGRPCTQLEECTDNTVYDSSRFRCEHIGLAGTLSVEGRVRYRGIMEDPNELAMALSLALPFAFALFQSRRTPPRFLLAAVALTLFGLCTIFTHSRGGQLAFLAVLGIYLLRRLGWAGLAAAAALGAPVMLLGGREGEGADQSTMERIECWSSAIDMFRGSPLVGVGKTQFSEHHYLTAHNSFMLALAETGLPGLFLFSSVVYLAFKAAFTSARDAAAPDDPARVWGNAIFASLGACMVSAFFLSQTDRVMVWTCLGLAGGLASAAAARDATWKLRYSVREAMAVLAADAVLVAGVFVYARMHGA
jgi:O-antigen ligase/polysaccharide polymerase Wzy-like membrane protein